MENERSITNSSSVDLYSTPAGVVSGVVALVSVFLGFFGNSITILALCKSRKIREHATTWFILSLSLSDLLFSSLGLPFLAMNILCGDWVFGDALCRIAPYILYVTLGTSLVSMVSITINRYVLIVHHSWYARIYTKRNILGMIGLGWLPILGIWFLPVVGLWGEFGYNGGRRMCTLLEKDGKSPRNTMFLGTVLIPCTAIVLCYARIFVAVRRSRRKLQTQRNGLKTAGDNRHAQGGVSKEDIQLIKMVVLTFCVYIGSFLPVVIVRFMRVDESHPSTAILAAAPISCTCWTNLVIYVWCNQEYREAYRKLLFGAQRGAGEATASSRVVRFIGDL